MNTNVSWWPVLIQMVILCPALGCGNGIGETVEQEVTQGIEGGVTVSTADIRKTGAVKISGCSGTLVTPYWVLTAAHCSAFVGGQARLGNSDDPTAPASTIAYVSTHPSFSGQSGGCRHHDASLLRLATPLWPLRSDGSIWERYRRDIYRGSFSGLEDTTNVDVYGYGAVDSNGNGSGVLRFAAMIIDGLSSLQLEYDSIDDEYTQGGDSGAGVLLPSHGSVGAFADYTVAAVHTCWHQDVDLYSIGTRSDSIASWFDDQIGNMWTQFDAPSQILAATMMNRL